MFNSTSLRFSFCNTSWAYTLAKKHVKKLEVIPYILHCFFSLCVDQDVVIHGILCPANQLSRDAVQVCSA